MHIISADYIGLVVCMIYCFLLLEHKDRGFKFNSGHRCNYALFLLLCCPPQLEFLGWADPPSWLPYHMSVNEVPKPLNWENLYRRSLSYNTRRSE
jgi:hypothetical protein